MIFRRLEVGGHVLKIVSILFLVMDEHFNKWNMSTWYWCFHSPLHSHHIHHSHFPCEGKQYPKKSYELLEKKRLSSLEPQRFFVVFCRFFSRYSGTLNPTLNLTAQQMEMLQSKLGTQRYQQPGPRTRTLGYRGFVLQGLPVLRGCSSAPLHRGGRLEGWIWYEKICKFCVWWRTRQKHEQPEYQKKTTNLGKQKNNFTPLILKMLWRNKTNFGGLSQGKDAELYLLELFRPQLPETRRFFFSEC